jgi:hypothetical protein
MTPYNNIRILPYSSVCTIALGTLSEMLSYDIRSCLNTLQFAHTKNQSINERTLGSLVGEKDITQSQFAVWEAVFNNKPPR